MNLYEFVTPSDTITFYAKDEETAVMAVFFLGKGKAFLKNDKSESIAIPTIFGNIEDSFIAKVKARIDKKDTDFIAALKTFACVSVNKRPIFDKYTENGTDKEKFAEWDDKNRSSLNDWCGYARGFAEHLEGTK